MKSAAAASGSGTAWNVKFIFAILFILMFSKQVYISSLTNFLTFYVMEKFHVDPVTAQYALFAFLGAGAAGTLLGGPITDRFGRRKVIFGSIFGAAPFALLVPYVGFWGVIALVILVSFVISSAFSAILVCALDVAPRHTGMVSGVFFGLTFGLGGAPPRSSGGSLTSSELRMCSSRHPSCRSPGSSRSRFRRSSEP